MRAMRRRVFTAATLCLMATACAGRATREASASFAAFLERMDGAQRELQQGRPDAYKALWSQRPDVTLAGGFGGGFEQGWDRVSARLDWAGAQFRNGRNTLERLASSVSGDLGYAVQTEHIRFESPASGAPLERRYRVTLLFRREAGEWRILHRHADTQTTQAPPR